MAWPHLAGKLLSREGPRRGPAPLAPAISHPSTLLVMARVALTPREEPPAQPSQRSASTPAARASRSRFHPHVGLRCDATTNSLSRLLQHIGGSPVPLVLGESVLVRAVRFRWHCDETLRVPCIVVKYVEVQPCVRRQGHARCALRLLSLAAADNKLALVVEDVISEHMHALVQQLGGRRLPGDARTFTYWLPPASHALRRIPIMVSDLDVRDG